MTTPHSTLTGTDLHEVKGASTATSGQVPIANGTGGAPFGKLTASSLTGTGNAFGGQLLHVTEIQNSGVNSTTDPTAHIFATTSLNTVLTNEISGASLAANVISLPAGTYFISARIPFDISTTGAGGDFLQPVLFNSTASTNIVTGIPSLMYGSVAGGGIAQLHGRFTLSGTSSLILRHYKTNGNAGRPVNSGLSEVYAEALIWKVA